MGQGVDIWDMDVGGVINTLKPAEGTYYSVQGFQYVAAQKQVFILWNDPISYKLMIEVFDFDTLEKVYSKELDRAVDPGVSISITKISMGGHILCLSDDRTFFEIWDIKKEKPELIKEVKRASNEDWYLRTGYEPEAGVVWIKKVFNNESYCQLEVIKIPSLDVIFNDRLDDETLESSSTFFEPVFLSEKQLVIDKGLSGFIIYDFKSKQKQSFDPPRRGMRSLAFSADSKYAAATLDGGEEENTEQQMSAQLIVYDLQSGDLVGNISIPDFAKDNYVEAELAFSENGEHLLILGKKGENKWAEIIDWKASQIVHSRALPSGQYSSAQVEGGRPAHSQWMINFNAGDYSSLAYLGTKAPFQYSYMGQKREADMEKIAQYYNTYSYDASAVFNVPAITVSNNGKWINLLYPNGKSEIKSGKSFEVVHKWQVDRSANENWISLFDPSETIIVQYPVYSDKNPVCFDVKTGKRIGQLDGSKNITAYYFSGNSEYILGLGSKNIQDITAGMFVKVWSSNDLKKIKEGDMEEMLKEYPYVMAEYFPFYGNNGQFGFGNPITQKRSFSLWNHPFFKDWVITTEDGRFGGVTEDLAYVFEVDGKIIKSVDAQHPKYLKEFLHSALEKKRSESPLQTRKDYALLFAVQDYADGNGWKDLGNPVNDANVLAELLRSRYGFEVEVVTNPTQADINQKLREYYKKTYNSNDQLFVFFSGHGQKDPDYEEDGYLVPSDGMADAMELSTCISHQDFMRRIDNIPCNHILVVADACFSGRMGAYGELRRNKEKYDRGAWMYRGKTDEEYLQKKLQDKSRIFFASGSDVVPDGIKGRHTPFMSFLLGALEQDRGDMRFLSIGVLKEDVEWVDITTPVYGDFGKGMATGNFLFVVQPKE